MAAQEVAAREVNVEALYQVAVREVVAREMAAREMVALAVAASVMGPVMVVAHAMACIALVLVEERAWEASVRAGAGTRTGSGRLVGRRMRYEAAVKIVPAPNRAAPTSRDMQHNELCDETSRTSLSLVSTPKSIRSTRQPCCRPPPWCPACLWVF